MKTMTGKYAVMGSALLVSLMLSGCQSPMRSSTDDVNDKRTGASVGTTCRTDVAVSASGGPDALYAEMNACVKAQQYDSAVFLYALAGSYTWFDAERVGTQYARMAHSKRLGASLSQLSEKQVSQLWDKIRATMQDPKAQAKICEQVKQAGMPTHSASYMRIDKSSNNVDAPVARHYWESAVNSYLLCK